MLTDHKVERRRRRHNCWSAAMVLLLLLVTVLACQQGSFGVVADSSSTTTSTRASTSTGTTATTSPPDHVELPVFSWGSDRNSKLFTGDNAQDMKYLKGKNISEVVGTSSAFAVRIAVDDREATQFINRIKSLSSVTTETHEVLDGSRAITEYVVWGDAEVGGIVTGDAFEVVKPSVGSAAADAGALEDPTQKGHIIFANDVCPLRDAFVAVLDGKLACWGSKVTCAQWQTVTGGQSNLKVVKVFCPREARVAFPLLNSNHPKYGGYLSIFGDIDSGAAFPSDTAFQGLLKEVRDAGLIQAVANEKAVAVLLPGGIVQAWGDKNTGGTIPDPSAAQFVKKLVANSVGFAALKSAGSVVSWGAFYQRYIPKRITEDGLGKSHVKDIIASRDCFVALLDDGSIATWGAGNQLYCNEEGAIGSVEYVPFRDIQASVQADVVRVVPSDDAFCAIKSNGAVVTWGNRTSGGTTDQPATGGSATQLHTSSVGLALPDTVQATCCAFSFIRTDGGFAAWGNVDFGGFVESTHKNQIARKLLATRREVIYLDTSGGIVVNSGDQYGYWGKTGTDAVHFINAEVTHLFGTSAGFMALFGKDCEVGPLGAWSVCTASCGGGTQSRSREVVKYPQNGYCTQSLREDGTCNTAACAESSDIKFLSNLSTGEIIAIAGCGVLFIGLVTWGLLACCSRRRRTLDSEFL